MDLFESACCLASVVLQIPMPHGYRNTHSRSDASESCTAIPA